MKKYLAEFLGTAALVIIGCGAVAIGGYGSAFPLGVLPVALAFGLAVTAMAYGIGPVSGCHVNPAVTLAVWASGRMATSDLPGYIVAQCLGALVGAGILLFVLSGRAGGYDVATAGLGQNGWGEGYLGNYGVASAIVAEFVATFLFAVVILGATSPAGTTPVAGLAIGLTLAVLHLPFINVTGLSVNPARSLGPAVFVGGKALAQLWLFIVIPALAGICAGLLFKSKTLEA
ncbi:aquaporin [Chelatococcus sp. SYSU_G07232]|uniref:Aquaporin n=1 Tax=Chelatococcus albus TaxID=3047466 RepID=A0ABT7ALJ5_9HYPH|nr:aquaporin [Chelatococcus sp. SYSU_G07232]MDJ1160259.1 aquaporin [Chelatococcus sp. SYSU_G07232]